MEGVHQQYQLMCSPRWCSIQDDDELRGAFESPRIAWPRRAPAFDAFLARPGYSPDSAARGPGEQCNAMISTRDEMVAADAGPPRELIGDGSAYEHEKANLPRARGRPPDGSMDGPAVLTCSTSSVTIPIELRWLVYRKRG